MYNKIVLLYEKYTSKQINKSMTKTYKGGL